MKNIKGCLILFILILIIAVVFYVIALNFFVASSVEETIRINENVSKEIHVDVWIVEHEWKSDWYVIGYMFKKYDYSCSKQEKEKSPWKCNNIPYSTTMEYVWFNTKTREIHDAWSEIF